MSLINYRDRKLTERERRVAALLDKLNGGEPIKAGKIAFQLNTGSRTIRRDLHYMRDALQLPIKSCTKGFYLETPAKPRSK
jgi:predicted DNA-binding transcriptional regulator YafY